MSPCTCGHPHEAHEHYRRGSDCSVCLCPRFDAGSWWRRGLAPRRHWLPKTPALPTHATTAKGHPDERAS